ncbi:MAG: histone H1 [Alistipes sp.]|nr:histone H1 [Alistipes sp.]
MENLLSQINEQINIFTDNASQQVEKDNKAAGTHARKAALELTKLMKEFRKASVEADKK